MDQMDRRQLLISLAAIPLAPSGSLARDLPGEASAEVSKVARILIGRPDFSEIIIGRAQAFQTELDTTFPDRLAKLVAAVSRIKSSDREIVISRLSKADVTTAIQLIAPLYLGYTGAPTTTKAFDNAKFVTFLNALMYETTSDNLPLPSYAIGGPNYWTAVPRGVTAPPMPANILDWGDNSPKAAPTYATPDPRYVAMCQGHGKTLAEAEAWLASKK